MPFWVCYYHIICVTKNRKPLISPAIEQVIIDTIRSKSIDLECPIHAINTAWDHMHIAVSIPPQMAVAQWIGQIKGRSAHESNAMFPQLEDSFRWQEGYGVLSFGKKVLPTVCEYIERQKEHHQNNTLMAYMEQIDGQE